ncbi:hypothetical protein FACS1894207_3730 [Bacteroidia bacterium]|nr:hypothetical protein FACS1894207_3730 [Bacteroidia bacterium]
MAATQMFMRQLILTQEMRLQRANEVILFEDELTDDKLSQIESYLGIKYGITLRESVNNSNVNLNYDYKMSDGAGGSTVFWAGKSNALFKQYHNNVAAVIRDDAATLHNPQSHSTDLGSIVHMGVAGTKLGFTSGADDVGDLDYDREVIVWGSNNDTGITSTLTQPCGDFENIFNKKWLVHKKTHDDRPITMLVGAQNNSTNNLGLQAEQAIKDMYGKLGAGYDVCLIVGDSEADINNHIYKAVVPMSFIDGEHQCSYTFTEENTYITFGYKENRNGCAGEVEFSGKKTADWKAWSRHNYALNGTNSTPITPKGVPFVPVDLGDDIKVTDMKITYGPGVRSENYYPITNNSPFKGGLQLRRNQGVLNSSKVTVEVTFNHPVIPSFSIAGLDAHWSQYDAVLITGECSSSGVLPTLSYAGNPQNAFYTIAGSKATVNKNTRSGSGTDANSRVNIDFAGGVDKIVIEYTIANHVDLFFSANQEIYISPITLSPVPSPPPINEDGLSFVKEVKERDITTCEPVEYSFYIQNTNCEDKYVHFSDILPAGMKWLDGSLALDTINWFHNNKLDIIDYGGTNALDIDSLLIPGAKTLKLRATAVLDKTAPSGKYDNRASIVYHKLVKSKLEEQILRSRDRETLKDYTWFNASFAQRQDTVLVTAVPSPRKYKAKNDITVTYTVNNPNDDITNMFLDIAFNANFRYGGSFSSSLGAAAKYVTPDPSNPDNPSISIAGTDDSATGFTLPKGTLTFTFTLTAPDAGNLVKINGKTSDLTISYEFTTTQNDPCVLVSMSKLSGIMNIPYSNITHIITNKNVTINIK